MSRRMRIFTALRLRRFIEDPRNRLTQLLVLSIVVTVYFYVYFYQNIFHIQIPLIGINTLIEMPIMLLVVIPLVKYLIVKPDPLQRSPSQRRPIRFFQNEFPSRYILERCKRCIEDENSCPNYIKAESYTHVRYWFNDILHGAIESEDPKSVRDTFEKGYTCKLLYYLLWVLGIFCGLAIATIVVYHGYLYFFDEFKIELTPFQIIFPLVCGGIIILIIMLNKPDDSRPSGCWQAWRQINRIHISWLRSHEDFLVNLICHASGGTKSFKEKQP